MRLPVLAAAFAFGIVNAATAPARAEPQGPFALRNTTNEFLAVEVGAAAVVALAGSVVGSVPSQCGWCEPTSFDRSVRNALVWSDRRTAATLSHVVSVGVAPLFALGAPVASALAAHQSRYALEDAAMILAPLGVVTGLTETTKKIAARERPAFYFHEEGQTEYADSPRQQFLSFYSADTARVWALGSASATVCWLRGYAAAPYVTAGAVVAGIGAGWLRIGADVHWATDVIAGSAIGAAFGIGMPLLLHRRDTMQPGGALLVPMPVSGGMGLSLNGAW